MKIGIDASRYSHETATGVEWYSFHLINAMLEELSGSKEHEAVLYSREKLQLPKGVKKVKNDVIRGQRLWTLWKLSMKMQIDLPEVLFVPSHMLPMVLPKRSVITIHDVAFKYLKNAYSFKQYQYLNWGTHRAVSKADKIVVPSKATMQDLMSFFDCPEEKIEVVPHGFTAPKFKKTFLKGVFQNAQVFQYFELNEESKYFLFVGRLESKKNLVRLVKAFAAFHEAHPEYKLVLAGKRGVGFKQVLATVEELGLDKAVIMPGYVTEEEKAALYMHACGAVLPSLYEGFGLPILEAFHYNVPVMCSRVSSLPEVGGEAVHYIDPYDVEMMQAGMERFVTDSEYREELMNAGKKQLRKFSWKKAAEKTLKVIHGQ